MYFIENIRYFLDTDYGHKIPEEIREAILDRAQDSATEDGIIHSSGTHYIFANTHFEQLFEKSVKTDENQLKIRNELAENFLE